MKIIQVFVKTYLIFCKTLLFVIWLMNVLIKLITKTIFQSFTRKIGTIIGLMSLASLVQAAAVFHLPMETQGLQIRQMATGKGNGVQIVSVWEEKTVNTVKVDCEKVECVIGVNGSHPNDPLYLYFPTNGKQPTTDEAGEYSGARYNGSKKDDVTDWWVRVFGGPNAVMLANGRQDTTTDVPMGFDDANNPVHIIRVNGNESFKKDFWKTFRTIAADPVGRVLLYRLLIEIRRVDRGNGCCGDDVVLPRRYNLKNRNNCRSLEIKYSNDGCCFCVRGHYIEFDTNANIRTSVLSTDATVAKVTTEEANRDCDVALFHEMLHWFHYLRNSYRFNELDSDDPLVFKYPLRFYYGNVNELSVWGGSVDAEEIATILGVSDLTLPGIAYLNLIPNNAFLLARSQPNDIEIRFLNGSQYIPNSERFLNGDDLSENVYRASKTQNGNLHYMRFGHVTTAIEPVSYAVLPNRFQLAHQVVLECYRQITGNNVQNWGLAQGEAIK